ncbi:MAG TPA: DUF2600 family protein [Firmicutes bacterium]|nr:DUF2600 family protein [Bacillota bacterium]
MSPVIKPLLLLEYTAKFPAVKKLLQNWWRVSAELPPQLREQAQASIRTKAFHCIGGAIYALYPGVNQEVMLKAIVALQTISDYLDNLCDRMQINDDRAFRQLHLSFLDALDLSRPLHDYYQFYPYRESVYLNKLVETCRCQIRLMPFYQEYQTEINCLAEYYCELQVLKHLTPSGEHRLKNWIAHKFMQTNTDLAWNEWAAATGSTLGIFFCFAASFQQYSHETKTRMHQAYFPWIQSLHILLDYFIDRSEDRVNHDLNFTFYHHNHQHAAQRIAYIYQKSREMISQLPHRNFHQLILDGLIAMYGSDPKLREQKLDGAYLNMLDTPTPYVMLKLCRILRAVSLLS